jgi:hypothetical protein
MTTDEIAIRDAAVRAVDILENMGLLLYASTPTQIIAG